VSQKQDTLFFYQNFDKRSPIFNILSLIDSQENFVSKRYKDFPCETLEFQLLSISMASLQVSVRPQNLPC